ncbi:MAG: AMP-binding protein [Gemmatimonadota bacterium]|nr:AMP-binding protein [Gemmatimonadota bacterium]
MNAVQSYFDRLTAAGTAPAFHQEGVEYTYAQLMDRCDRWSQYLDEHAIGAGTVCAFIGDYSFDTCSLILALIRARTIFAPLTPAVKNEITKFLAIAGVEVVISQDFTGAWVVTPTGGRSDNALINAFRKEDTAGLVVFTSGSTGEPKGILHSCERVLKKFSTARDAHRTVLFLLMDHFGGFNTLLGVFANLGVGIRPRDRSPAGVCEAVERGRATLLPTTPTFLNLLITSGEHRNYDLSSVRLITYGTEVMSDATLRRVHEAFPNAELKQTYGLSELGVLRSKSEGSASTFVRLGGPGFEVKIVDDTIWIRSEANMVGYLNAPTPFDSEGWLCTGDKVERKGEFVRILGRESDVINIGGQKVFPVEVETVLCEAANVSDASVYAAPHSLLGSVVHATVTLSEPEDPTALRERLRLHCTSRLARYKVPVKIEIASDLVISDRYKKMRDRTASRPNG